MAKGVVLALAAILCGGGCGTASKPVVAFPEPEALAKIERKGARLPAINEGAVPESWTVELGAALPPPGAWDQAVEGAAGKAGKKVRFSPVMRCVAREVVRYLHETGKMPPAILRDFLAGACGATTLQFGLQTVAGTAPAEVTEEAVLESSRKSIDGMVKGLPGDGAEAGFFYERRPKGMHAALVYVRPSATLEPFALVPNEQGEINVAGRVHEQAVQYIAAYVNRGRFGVDACFVDPTVTRPRFKVTCNVAPEDETAAISIVYAQPGRVLAMPVAQMMARKQGVTTLTYRAPARAAAGAKTPEEFATGVLAALNRVRQEAGLGAVKLAGEQSATAARVAQAYFAAAMGGGIDDMEIIALGLLAGWNVTSGLIRDGTFVSTLVPETRDPNLWLAATLDLPSGRLALLAPEIEEIALGPALASSPDAAGAVAVGYKFIRGNDHERDVMRVRVRLTLARRKRGLSPPQFLSGLEAPMRDELGRVNAGKLTPRDALDKMLEVGVLRTQAPVRGWLLETTSLDALEIPEEVLRQPDLKIQIGVTHHRPPGAAWAQLVILVIFVDGGGAQTA